MGDAYEKGPHRTEEKKGHHEGALSESIAEPTRRHRTQPEKHARESKNARDVFLPDAQVDRHLVLHGREEKQHHVGDAMGDTGDNEDPEGKPGLTHRIFDFADKKTAEI